MTTLYRPRSQQDLGPAQREALSLARTSRAAFRLDSAVLERRRELRAGCGTLSDPRSPRLESLSSIVLFGFEDR
jgi:hypothetical protein